MTTRGLMLAVLLVACYLGFWAYLQRWEARRVVMYQQRDVTRAVMLEAQEVIAAAGPSTARLRLGRDRRTYTSHWAERLEVWESRDGKEVPLIRAVVSGTNGRFSIPPIVVETYGSSRDAPWLDRLIRAYKSRGWQYTVVDRPNP